jgi:hypothetical protein
LKTTPDQMERGFKPDDPIYNIKDFKNAHLFRKIQYGAKGAQLIGQKLYNGVSRHFGAGVAAAGAAHAIMAETDNRDVQRVPRVKVGGADLVDRRRTAPMTEHSMGKASPAMKGDRNMLHRSKVLPVATPGKLATETINDASAKGHYDTGLSHLDPVGTLRMALTATGSAHYSAESDVGLIARGVGGVSGRPSITTTEHGINVKHRFIYGTIIVDTGADNNATRQFNTPLGCWSSTMADFRPITQLYQVMKFNKFKFTYISQSSKEWVGAIAIGKGANILEPVDPGDIIAAGGIAGTVVRDIKDDFSVEYGASSMLSTSYPQSADQMPFCCYGTAFCVTQGVTGSSGSVLNTGTTLGWIEIEIDFDLYAIDLSSPTVGTNDLFAAALTPVSATATPSPLSVANAFALSGFIVGDTTHHDIYGFERFSLSNSGIIQTDSSSPTSPKITINAPPNTFIDLSCCIKIEGTGLASVSLPAVVTTGLTVQYPVVNWEDHAQFLPYSSSDEGPLGIVAYNPAVTALAGGSTTFQGFVIFLKMWTGPTGSPRSTIQLVGTYLSAATTITGGTINTAMSYSNIPSTNIFQKSFIVRERQANKMQTATCSAWPEYSGANFRVPTREVVEEKGDSDDDFIRPGELTPKPQMSQSTMAIVNALSRLASPGK